MTSRFKPASQEELAARGIGVTKVAPVNHSNARRARKNSGQFKADDPSTPDVNEAWEHAVENKE